jgi:hypothetical protein
MANWGRHDYGGFDFRKGWGALSCLSMCHIDFIS